MKLYRKLCRPYIYIPGEQGWSEVWKPLEDWQPEENEKTLREKYTEDVIHEIDKWGYLKFKYGYRPIQIVDASNLELKFCDATEEIERDLIK